MMESRVILLGSENVSELIWEEYLSSNPTIVFGGMKVLQINRKKKNEHLTATTPRKVVKYIENYSILRSFLSYNISGIGNT